jgi:hypothetical protein
MLTLQGGGPWFCMVPRSKPRPNPLRALDDGLLISTQVIGQRMLISSRRLMLTSRVCGVIDGKRLSLLAKKSIRKP